ncbi:hypothetical protein BJ170DRAFT_288296 [Xylariales sp. AK1849]|nr:hypothetical protein BJ170DRAFT_288296 [Xylariales sp. AK1849]
MDWDSSRAPSTYSMYSLSSNPSKSGVEYNYYAVAPESTPILSKEATEKPKAPLRRHFNPFRHLIHLIALAASGAVLQLSFRNVYWSDETAWDRKWYLFGLGQQDTFNGLQFVAKIHEILVVASLSSMVIHIARRKLVGEDGIPFGLLMGAYQVGSAEYLFSGSFGYPFLRSLRPLRWKTFLFALGLGLAIIYANMVGPASAVAVIPNLDWWPIRDPFAGRDLKSYIRLSFDESYPTAVTYEDIEKDWRESCAVTDPDIQCPGGGYGSIQQWAYAWSQEGIIYDIPMGGMLIRAERELGFRFARASPSSPGVAFATTLKSSAAMLADLFWQYISTNNVGKASSVERPQLSSTDDSELYAPLVQVQCDIYENGAARQSQNGITFSTNLLSNFTDSSSNAYNQGNTWEVPRDLWDFDHSGRAIDFTWVDVSQLDTRDGKTVHASIGALATIPSLWVSTWENGSQTAEQRSMLVPCMIDARWAAAQITYDPKNDLRVKHNLSDLSTFVDPAARNSNERARLGLSDTISINTRWAAYLNPDSPGFSDVKSNASDYQDLSAMENLLYQFVVPSTDEDGDLFYGFAPPQNVTNQDYYANITSVVAGLISMVVADGLARESHGASLMELKPEHGGNVTLVNLQYLAGGEKEEPFEWPASDLETKIPITFNVQRWGWGYGLKSQTVSFAVAVLFLHAALCVCYFMGTFIFWVSKGGWTSHSWKDVGDLVALALTSREPEEFRNSGAGITKSETLTATMNIRERGDSGIEVVANYNGGKLAMNESLLRVRKKYGS